MMRLHINSKYDCCGCTACASICNRNAIEMRPDSLGFYYPHIDDSKCINCGLCVKVCQFHEGYERYDNFDEPIVFGGRHKDLRQVTRSQSGAASFAIIDSFLNKEGVVYGVAFAEGFHVVHKRVINKKDCEAFRGSKYVQSDIRGIFLQVKNDLKDKQRVLFFGTSCQVAGLRSFIPKQLSEKLYTVDLLCHACSSPAVWEEYVKYIEKKYKQKVITANFRNKKFGWRSHIETFQLEKQELSRTTFRLMFSGHLCIRQSCSVCHYANLKRIGDISIADFWGWNKYHAEWNDKKGVSLFLINSRKGEKILNSIKNEFELIKSNTKECLQANLLAPSKLDSKHDDFIKDFEENGFEYCGKKYADLGWIYKVKQIWKKMKHYSGYNKIMRLFLNNNIK